MHRPGDSRRITWETTIEEAAILAECARFAGAALAAMPDAVIGSAVTIVGANRFSRVAAELADDIDQTITDRDASDRRQRAAR